MTVGQFVTATINANICRDGYYMEKNPDAALPLFRLLEWVLRGQPHVR